MARTKKVSSSTEGSRGKHGSDERLSYLDHDVAQLTKLGSSPNAFISRAAAQSRNSILRVSPVKMLACREMNISGKGRFSAADNCHISSRYLPVHGPRSIYRMNSRAYVSQFSSDGSLFVAAFQFRFEQENLIRIYNVDNWKTKKDIMTKSLRWTITDASLSPDQQHLVYSSISPVVHIVNVGSGPEESHANVTEIHEELVFSNDNERRHPFGIFSVKFSNDGRELLAACNDGSIYAYDLAKDKVTLRIPAHSSDVNAVCFADESGHLIYSGGDDNLCKIWDRRCFSAKGQAAGVLEGHLEGITFIDSRGDGRYFISNGKDQAIKLWDIRKMSSKIPSSMEREFEWDYRWMEYPSRARNLKHPNDLSVSTYKGHLVLRTLIRCYFSPVYSTGQKYIYTGSSDSSVYIYDLVSGEQVGRLDHHEDTVRDCNWHPYYPMLISSSWDGTIARWEFPGEHENPVPVKMNGRSTRSRGRPRPI
ncbi:LEC14B homolog isoform X2 [Impatiens glandulifera]|uniref:LEC14B homolog isoform X2 n=1 Tax=Impatiens glandulifera TaxID=253017 RepID=UPI001FB146CD|nr:LEC14B homolog isoform X2 [Impatiens glandulifera]